MGKTKTNDERGKQMTETQTKYVVVGDGDAEIAAMEQRLTRWPEQMSSQERYQLATVAVAYGLDPIMGDLTMYQGKPYVTIGGLRRLAQRQGLDGSEVYPLTPEERALQDIPDGEYAYKAIIWKRGSSHPYIDYGRAGQSNVSLKTRQGGDMPIAKWLRELAMKRAEARALRKAFSVGVVGRDEVDERDDFNAPKRGEIAVDRPQTLQITAPTPKNFDELDLAGKLQMLWEAATAKYSGGKPLAKLTAAQLAEVKKQAVHRVNLELRMQGQPAVERFSELTDEGVISFLYHELTSKDPLFDSTPASDAEIAAVAAMPTPEPVGDPITGEVIN
jgi:hypothetical protein